MKKNAKNHPQEKKHVDEASQKKFPPKLKKIASKTQKKLKKFTDEELRCRDISPEHCEELRDRKFTNNPEDVFLEVRALEEKYKFIIDEVRAKSEKEIEEKKEKLAKKYKVALKNKEKEIARDIDDMEEEIQKNLEALEIQEQMILSQIDLLYKTNKDQLIEDALEIIGFGFLCEDNS